MYHRTCLSYVLYLLLPSCTSLFPTSCSSSLIAPSTPACNLICVPDAHLVTYLASPSRCSSFRSIVNHHILARPLPPCTPSVLLSLDLSHLHIFLMYRGFILYFHLVLPSFSSFVFFHLALPCCTSIFHFLFCFHLSSDSILYSAQHRVLTISSLFQRCVSPTPLLPGILSSQH